MGLEPTTFSLGSILPLAKYYLGLSVKTNNLDHRKAIKASLLPETLFV